MSLEVDLGLLALAALGIFIGMKYEMRCPNLIAGLVTIPALMIGAGLGWTFNHYFSTSRYAFYGVMGVAVFFIAFVYDSTTTA